MSETGAQTRDIVLVVDDSPDTLRMLTDAIERSGATVLVALEGEQALSIAAEITPDIVLMDAVMPGMDGFETTRRLKANAALRHVPVIFMTGLTETEHVVKGLEAGGVDYVAKPLVPDELLARIRVHLANARAAQNARAALDTAGRFLLAADGEGRILWATPQATRLLAVPGGATGGTIAGNEAPDPGSPGGAGRQNQTLPDPLRTWLRAGSATGGELSVVVPSADGRARLHFTFLGRVGEDEHLFRLTAEDTQEEAARLRGHFKLTVREADVLLWLARGKSNRDIATILTLSPRTVNKHLETVFAKLGVENRASAAVLAMRMLGEG